MELEVGTILVLGALLGLKHALDADHLIAVSTIVSDQKQLFSSSIVGAMWGIGHTAALLLVALLVIALGIQIPERLALAMEFAVASMLVFLGGRLLWGLYRGDTLHVHIHRHNEHEHIHPHIHPFDADHSHSDAVHESSLTRRFIDRLLQHAKASKRSMLIGMVHGMAGSAGLMLIVLTTIPSKTLALGYVAVFGIGSIGGMVLMSSVIGLPFILAKGASTKLYKLVQVVAGISSVLFGVFLGWQIGFVEGLFL